MRHFKAGRTVTAWRGPYLGVGPIQGETWRPYIPIPSFPEYTSGHSTFSGAAAAVLKDFRGGSTFGSAPPSGRAPRSWSQPPTPGRGAHGGKKMGEGAFSHAKKLWEGG